MPDLQYSDDFVVRRVRSDGSMVWRNGLIFVSEALSKEPVGLKQLDDRYWALYYGRVPLAILDDHKKRWTTAKHAVLKLKQIRKELYQSSGKC